MPKIPTFTSKARPTAEVAGVKSNLQIDPTKTPAAGLSALAGVAQDYYIKQRDNVEKLEANKKFYEMKTEGAKIANELKNNPNEFEVENIYNNRFSSYKNSVIQGIKNKRVRKKIENLISLDQPETIYKLKQNAFKQYEIQENEMYNTKQNTYANEYSLELDLAKKDQKKQQRLDTAKEYESKMLKGKEWLSKELKKIETDSVIFDADKALSNNNPALALEIIKRADKSKVNSEELQKKILEINKFKKTVQEKNFESNVTSIATNTPFSNLGKLSDTNIPFSGDKNKDFKLKNKFRSSIEKIQKTIDKEGSAEFYTNNDETLSQLNSNFNKVYASVMVNPTKENIEIVASSFDKYAIAANEKNIQLNVPEEKRTLLTNAAITNLKQRIEGARGDEQKLRVLDEVKKVYGNHLPSVIKQINNRISPSVAFAISVDDPDLKLSSIQGSLKEEELTIFKTKVKGTISSPEVTIGQSVQEELESFSNIIVNQPRSKVNPSDAINPIISNITTAVMRKVINSNELVTSSNVTSIAKKYTKQFMSDYNLTNDTYWIPKKIGNKPVNEKFFEAQLEVFKTSLKYNMIDFSKIKIKPVGDGKKLLSEEETLEFFKKNGEFYLNSNDEVYFGVKDNNGQPRKFMYSTILEKGKEQYKPLTKKFLDNSGNIGGFHNLDMEDLYNYISISETDIPEEALTP